MTEFLAQLATTKDDPSKFSELCFGTPLHSGQIRFIEGATGQTNILTSANSFGKTHLVMVWMCWAGWWKHGTSYGSFQEWLETPWRGLVASYTYGIAQESFDRLIHAVQHAHKPIEQLVVKIDRNESEILLANGSRLEWGSLDSRGRLVEAARYNFICVDEAGHIPDLKMVYDNILYPRTLGVNGRICLIGTPKEHTDPWLLEAYERGLGDDPFFHSMTGAAFENEFWPAEERDRVLANPSYVVGWRDWTPEDDPHLNIDGRTPILTPVGRQVLLGEFALTGGTLFNPYDVARIFVTDPEGTERWGDDLVRVPPQPGHRYVGAFDLGGSNPGGDGQRRSDPTVGIVLDITEKPYQIVYYNYIHGGDADWEDRYRLMHEIYEAYSLPWLRIDATGPVDSVVEALEKRGVATEGFKFTRSSKVDLVNNLRLALEWEWGNGQKGLLRGPKIPRLQKELNMYRLPDTNLEQDTVMALGMATHLAVSFDTPDATGEALW